MFVSDARLSEISHEFTCKTYFSGDHSDLWYCGLSVGKEQLGSIPDNPIVLFMGTCWHMCAAKQINNEMQRL